MFEDEYFSLLMSFLGVVLVIFCAFFGTKWFAKRYLKMSQGKNIKIIERMPLGQDKSLVLIGMAKKAYLLGVTGKEISTLCVLDEEDLVVDSPENAPSTEFSTVFADMLKKQLPFERLKKHRNENAEEKKK